MEGGREGGRGGGREENPEKKNSEQSTFLKTKGKICPGLKSSKEFTKTAKIGNYRNFRKIRSSCSAPENSGNNKTRDIHVIFVI